VVDSAPDAALDGARPTRTRFAIMVLLFVSVTINYLDRSNLSITAPAMRTALGIDTEQMGYVLSAFGWTYALCQIPGGWLVDRVAPRVLFATLIVAWSLATIVLGFTTSIAGLMAVRMLVGALEAPSYPTTASSPRGSPSANAPRRSGSTRRVSTSASRS